MTRDFRHRPSFLERQRVRRLAQPIGHSLGRDILVAVVLMLVLEVGVLGVFMLMDYFLFYVFWEIVLIPMYFLIATWGGPRREYASIKFFIYTHIASLVMLPAEKTGPTSMLNNST